MPVILTAPEEYEIWLSAPANEALRLQRPPPDDMLEIVAEGARLDQPSQGESAKPQSA
jgi:putative SOS response-associated peptidase YedK